MCVCFYSVCVRERKGEKREGDKKRIKKNASEVRCVCVFLIERDRKREIN